MSKNVKKSKLLGLLAGKFLSFWGKTHIKTTSKDIAKEDFKTSTQRLGVSFTKKIRDIFRSSRINNF